MNQLNEPRENVPKRKSYYQSDSAVITSNKALFVEIKNFIRQHENKVRLLKNICLNRPTFEDKSIRLKPSNTNKNSSIVDNFILEYEETIMNIKKDVDIVNQAFEKVPRDYLQAVKEHLLYDTSYYYLEAKYYVSMHTIKYYQGIVIKEVLRLKGYDKYNKLNHYYN